MQTIWVFLLHGYDPFIELSKLWTEAAKNKEFSSILAIPVKGHICSSQQTISNFVPGFV